MSKAKYLISKQTKAFLKIQDCDLAHIRNAGKLQFTKKATPICIQKHLLMHLIKAKYNIYSC